MTTPAQVPGWGANPDELAASMWNGHPVRRDGRGFFHLTDMWKANGAQEKNKPNRWLRNDRTRRLAQKIAQSPNLGFEPGTGFEPVVTIRGGNRAGTWGCVEIAVAYAAFLDTDFWLWMIRTFLRSQAAGPPATLTVHPSQIERVTGFALDERLAPLEAKLDEALVALAKCAKRIEALQRSRDEAPPARKKSQAFRLRGAKRVSHLRFVAQERLGLCPCCGQAEAVDPATLELVDGAKIARFRCDVPASGPEDFWPVCSKCLGEHRRKGFALAKRSAFDDYRIKRRRWLLPLKA